LCFHSTIKIKKKRVLRSLELFTTLQSKHTNKTYTLVARGQKKKKKKKNFVPAPYLFGSSNRNKEELGACMPHANQFGVGI
jgi:hypothetical protein